MVCSRSDWILAHSCYALSNCRHATCISTRSKFCTRSPGTGALSIVAIELQAAPGKGADDARVFTRLSDSLEVWQVMIQPCSVTAKCRVWLPAALWGFLVTYQGRRVKYQPCVLGICAARLV